MADHYDALESRDPAAREQALLSALPALITRATQAPGWSEILRGVTAGDITTRAALEQLPVTRKSSLKDLQHARQTQLQTGKWKASYSVCSCFWPAMIRFERRPAFRQRAIFA